MPKTEFIELGSGKRIERLPILYEDRSVLAIDKPAGWMLVPFSWQKTTRNLQAAITSSIAARDFWARSRNLKFLRFVHRLDAPTTGVLLFAKSPGGVETYSDLFEQRRVEKRYLVVVTGKPPQAEWRCLAAVSPDPAQPGRVKPDPIHGKPAETHFKVLAARGRLVLIEARPITGRTHQIRIHLAEARCPVIGDELYGAAAESSSRTFPLGLRSVELCYTDPFSRKRVEIRAPVEAFMRAFGFDDRMPENANSPDVE